MAGMKQLAVGAALLTLVLVGCGSGETNGVPKAGRNIDIEMIDNKFSPVTVSLTEGEAVTFVFTNSGSVEHEAIIGDAQVQDEHEAEMTGRGMDHDSSAAIAVAPGKTGELDFTADEAGTLLIGCHVPGHYEAGMKAKVEIE